MHQAASSIILPILLARPVICNAAICAQSIIPVIADSCGQSRTEPGLRENDKTHTQRAKLPNIRGSGTDPGSSIRTIADSRHVAAASSAITNVKQLSRPVHPERTGVSL